jgi:hypothetical protein
MKVRELLQCLQKCDPDADVIIASQPNWPIECEVQGATTRKDVVAWSNAPRDVVRPNDVILVQGEWLQYGQRDAWDVIRLRRPSLPMPIDD